MYGDQCKVVLEPSKNVTGWEIPSCAFKLSPQLEESDRAINREPCIQDKNIITSVQAVAASNPKSAF